MVTSGQDPEETNFLTCCSRNVGKRKSAFNFPSPISFATQESQLHQCAGSRQAAGLSSQIRCGP